MNYIPQEIVKIIADFHDYDKYCKPIHKGYYIHVLNDIIEISKIFSDDIQPNIVYVCWGAGWNKYLNKYILGVPIN